MITDRFSSTTQETAYKPISRMPDRRTDDEQPAEMSVLDRAAAQAGDWVGSHPVVSVAVGMAIGVTVGWLIKRR